MAKKLRQTIVLIENNYTAKRVKKIIDDIAKKHNLELECEVA